MTQVVRVTAYAVRGKVKALGCKLFGSATER